MFKITSKITSSTLDDTEKFTPSKQYRLMVAIAALVVISVLTTSGGSPIEHSISNPWEGFIWGIAEPVFGLDKLACIVALGLLSTRFFRSAYISVAFLFAAFFGQIIHLYSLNIPGGEATISTVTAVIAICTIISGIILVVPTTQITWFAVTILAILAGLSQGYVDSQAIINTNIVTMVTYLAAVTFAQAVIITSVQKISVLISKKAVNQILPRTIPWVGLSFCAIGIVFLSNVLI